MPKYFTKKVLEEYKDMLEILNKEDLKQIEKYFRIYLRNSINDYSDFMQKLTYESDLTALKYKELVNENLRGKILYSVAYRALERVKQIKQSKGQE